jgi:deoxyribodipyrimidine photolyase-related protein
VTTAQAGTGRTIWVLGDQLNRSIGALADAEPGRDRVLLVESTALLTSQRWHIQRAHLVIAAMRRFAAELRAEGFEVDIRRADGLVAGFAAHQAEHAPAEVVVTQPNSWSMRQTVERLGLTVIRSNQFLCHHDEFARWASTRRSLKMEDFYRQRRTVTGYLMDGEEPSGGRWNFDADNREPPPPDTDRWAVPPRDQLDDVDAAVLTDLPPSCFGAPPDGTWATDRAGALRRLDHFVEHVLPHFGPHEDAMTTGSWHLAHSTLSPYLNIGLLLPGEVCDAAQHAFDAGRVPLASAEGFIRQVIGWREYVWGVYWLWMPQYRSANELGAVRPLPPALTGAPTDMRCVASCVGGVGARAYNHHIQRLMVLGNLALLAGVDPWAMTNWMWHSFIDGAEWVMLPNVIGMSLHADGGRMATKPYAAGGNYIDRMSDYCGGCRYDRKRRTGDDACPFTTLYWDFLARHAARFGKNPRMARQVAAARQLSDLDAVRERAVQVLARLDRGEL